MFLCPSPPEFNSTGTTRNLSEVTNYTESVNENKSSVTKNKNLAQECSRGNRWVVIIFIVLILLIVFSMYSKEKVKKQTIETSSKIVGYWCVRYEAQFEDGVTDYLFKVNDDGTYQEVKYYSDRDDSIELFDGMYNVYERDVDLDCNQDENENEELYFENNKLYFVDPESEINDLEYIECESITEDIYNSYINDDPIIER